MDPLTENALKLAEVFNQHVDGHGHIHKEDLKDVFVELGMPMADADMDGLLQQMDVNGDGVIDLREFVTWITHDEGDASHIPKRSHVDQATPERKAGRETHHSDSARVKLECKVCGYKSYPQWLNDQAHCLKCDNVTKTRPSCHEKVAAKATSQPGPELNCEPVPLGGPTFRAGNADGGGKVKVAKKRNERVKMECPTCGYKSFPQWMNDQAHCLKCDTVIKKQKDVHGHINT